METAIDGNGKLSSYQNIGLTIGAPLALCQHPVDRVLYLNGDRSRRVYRYQINSDETLTELDQAFNKDAIQFTGPFTFARDGAAAYAPDFTNITCYHVGTFGAWHPWRKLRAATTGDAAPELAQCVDVITDRDGKYLMALMSSINLVTLFSVGDDDNLTPIAAEGIETGATTPFFHHPLSFDATSSILTVLSTDDNLITRYHVDHDGLTPLPATFGTIPGGPIEMVSVPNPN